MAFCTTVRGQRPVTTLSLAFGLFLHPGAPHIVVGDLTEMSQRDLSGDDWIVVCHVGLGIAPSMLHLDVKAHAKLVDVDGGPVNMQLVSDRPCFFKIELAR